MWLAKHGCFVWLRLSNQTKLSGFIWMKPKLKSKLERHYWNKSCWGFSLFFFFLRNKSCFGLVLFSSWAKLHKIFYLCLQSACIYTNRKSCSSWSLSTYVSQNVRSLHSFIKWVSPQQIDSSRIKNTFCLKYAETEPEGKRNSHDFIGEVRTNYYSKC